MASGKFNYRMVFGLDSSKFSKGLKSIEAQLGRFTATVGTVAGALGAGFGIGAIVAKLKDTAVDLSVANATLENTFTDSQQKFEEAYNRLRGQLGKGLINENEFDAGVKEAIKYTEEYGNTIVWLKQLSKDYNQDIIALTETFAKWHAAANAMKDDNGALKMDFETQKRVFKALTQASTFYHLSTERTRDAMVALEQMMSKGKVTAEELRRQLGNNLPGAFGLMASAVGVSTSELESMMKSGKLLADEVLPKFAEKLLEITQDYSLDSLQLQMNNLKNTWIELTQSTGFEDTLKRLVSWATTALDKLRQNIDYVKSSVVSLIAAFATQKIIKSLAKIITSTEAYKAAMVSASQATTNFGRVTKTAMAVAKGAWASFTAVLKTNAIFLAVSAIMSLASQLHNVRKSAKEARDAYKNLTDEFSSKKIEALNNAGITAEKLGLEDALKTLKEMNPKAKEYKTQLESIYSLIGEENGNLSASWDEINGKVQEYVQHLDDVALMEAYNGQIANARIEQQQKQNDIDNYNPGFWRKFWDTVVQTGRMNATRGLAGGFAGPNLTTGLENLQTEEQALAKHISELITERDKIITRLTAWGKSHPTTKGGGGGGGGGNEDAAKKLAKNEFWKIIEKYRKDKEDLTNQKDHGVYTGKEEEYADALDKINKAAAEGIYTFKDLEKEANRITALGATGVMDTIKEIQDAYKDIQRKEGYADAKKELSEWKKKYDELFNQYVQGVFEPKEYEDAVDDLVVDSYKAIAALGDFDEIMAKLPEDLKKILQTITDAFVGADNRVRGRGAKKAEDKLDTKYNKKFSADEVKYNRDSRYDFQKSNSKIAEETYDEYTRVAEAIKDRMDYIEDNWDNASDELKQKFAQLSIELEDMTKNATEFGNIAKTLKWAEVIDALQKQMLSTTYDTVREAAGSFSVITNAYRSLSDVINEANEGNASGWDVFLQTIESTFSVFDTIINLVEMFNTLNQLSTQLEKANSVEEIKNLATELALRKANNEAIAEKAGLLGTSTVALTAEAGAATAAASADAGKAIAGATAAGSSIPFPYNLLAIAAGIAAVVGALAMMGKYAEGGIVGGNSRHGDKLMARVNSGEMILNGAQQRNLWALANGKGNAGMGGNVQFVIRGQDLVGTLNNYNKIHR